MNLGKLAVTLPIPALAPRENVELAVRCEKEWGYDAIWLAETNGADSFSLAGAIAQATDRVEIGTAIVPVYNRTPALLAMSAATLADLSEGRFVLGLGTSSHAMIEGWHGLPFEQPLGRVRDTVTVLRSAFAGEKTAYHGKTLHSEGFRLGIRLKEPPRIFLAALRERMLQLAGALGDGLIINMMPLDSMPQIIGAYRQGAVDAERDGSDDDVVARFQIAVTDDKDAARNIVRIGFSGYVATPVYNRFFSWVGHDDVARGVKEAFARGDRAGTAAAMSDRFVDDLAIIGDADESREKLAAFVEAGVTTPVLAPLAASAEQTIAVLETFAPALQ
jgi:probable F420-dependent oxidoreductase